MSVLWLLTRALGSLGGVGHIGLFPSAPDPRGPWYPGTGGGGGGGGPPPRPGLPPTAPPGPAASRAAPATTTSTTHRRHGKRQRVPYTCSCGACTCPPGSNEIWRRTWGGGLWWADTPPGLSRKEKHIGILLELLMCINEKKMKSEDYIAVSSFISLNAFRLSVSS